MSTDTPNAESEVSIESRMAAVFGAEEAELPEAAPVEAAPETVEDANSEVAPEEVAQDGFEFEADDGTTLKLPAAAEPYVMRQKDYTQKTMAVAEREKMARDLHQFAEAREQLNAAIFENATRLHAKESELQQYRTADWAALFEANPSQALMFQQKMHNLEREVEQERREIGAKQQHFAQAKLKHSEFQWNAAEKAARPLLGNLTPAENVAMAQTIQSLGMTPDSFKERFADPVAIVLAYKAAKWDSLQAGKSKAVQTAQKAPPVVKPGAANPNASSADKSLRAQLKKSGDFRDAAKLLMKLG
jgi:hypothetical protein